MAFRQIVRRFSTGQAFQSNITPALASKVGRKLHLQKNHPLSILKHRIEDYFDAAYQDADGAPLFQKFDDMDPKVTTTQCFDDLLVYPDHPSRSLSDTFYYDENTLLRTHTSAHQTELMRAGHRAFLMSGDCYRRDEIDASHYPVFHQMEGVRLWRKEEVSDDDVKEDLTNTLSGLVVDLFGPVEQKWSDDYFPFTHPSFELEIDYQQKWLEILGCGVIHPEVLEKCGMGNTHTGWAFGIGLERLAMVMFNIPDIRLFWSQDDRFIKQFAAGKISQFKPFSKYPACNKDIAAWIPDDYHDNDFFSVVRDVAGDLAEQVTVVDNFTHPKTGRQSRCWRIEYRSLERTLTNAEVDEIHHNLRQELDHQGHIELR